MKNIHGINNGIWFIFLILTGLSSCTVYKEYPIDVYKPGVIAIPDEIINIAAVSRNFKFKTDTLQHYYKNDNRLVKDKKNQHLNIDSIAAVNALKGLASQLQTSDKFAKTDIWPYEMIKPHKGEKIAPFNWETVEKLTAPTNAGLLISLESISCFFSAFPSNGVDPAVNEVITASVWAIYNPGSKKIIEHKQLVDTVYWDGYDDNGKHSYNIPGRIEAIKIACELAGKDYAKRLSPSWMAVNRMFIIPPVDDFKKAAAYFNDGKLENAIRTWKLYADRKFRKLAINARYNIALAHEMNDDLANALVWITEAEKQAVSLKSKNDLKMIRLYKKIIQNRIKELENIN